MILRCNLSIGNLQKLFKLETEKDMGKIVFSKKIINIFTGRINAIDITDSTEYPFFRNGPLSSSNFKLYSSLHDDKSVVVKNGYSLNRYLKSKGYPLFLKSDDISRFIECDLLDVMTDKVISKKLESL